MRIFFRLMASLALLATTLTSAASAADTAGGKMKSVMPQMEKFLSIPEADRSLVWMVYRVKSRSQDGSDVKARYTMNGETKYLNLNKYGELVDLPDLQTYRANPIVETNVPKKDAVLSLRARPKIDMSTTFQVSTLQTSMEQADKVGRRLAGMFGFMRPSVKGYYFELPKDTEVKIIGKDGSVTPVETTVLNPLFSYVEFDKKDLSSLETIRFSQPPEFAKYKF